MKVTVESCLKKVDNRFKLVLMASKRAKDIERGARTAVARDDDKPTIIAMREIAEEAISLDNLENITRNNIINKNNEMQIEDEYLYNNETVDGGDDMDDDLDDEEDTMEEDEISDDAIEEELMEYDTDTDVNNEVYSEDSEEIYDKDK